MSSDSHAVDSITMLDVLNEEKEIEDETAAVLGGSDEKNCTYLRGPIKRQALYSCLTCVPDSKTDLTKSCGICLACSYACHENHDLVELYTKRNVVCDCGTPKMGKKCSLEEKTRDNKTNEYNQNYAGLYCSCHRPYPDPECSSDDEMIQCIICEDWHHSLHLDTEPSASQDYCEMICAPCVARVDFLKDYMGLCVVAGQSTAADESKDVNVSSTEDASTSILDESVAEKEGDTSAVADKEEEEKQKDETDSAPEAKKRKLEECDAAPSSSSASSSPPTKCKRPSDPGLYTKGALFWPDNWRDQLCVCVECKALYEKLNVEYLTDNEDTVKWYGDEGIKKLGAKESFYDRGMRQLSSLDRVRQIDAITAYNKMKDRLKEYLNQFVASQQVVTEADIKRFFQEMRNDDQKDLMVHSDIPFNCR